ncbi:hypothetical protein KVR01_010250 [Diaporthe batatas]|uniref:uncharacterized protein n=1 Tax=Diaporthe batatas TaxID=748121 RepID=UPI001D039E67|nr:uncharacterized protein KVR01_010250 [Diaporthe batatas]KAG8159613.1 hypothetical protein KVR01_010250 [Diaporthe batatas]
MMGFKGNEPSLSETEAQALPIASHLPPELLDVLIITRAHSYVHAILYNTPSFIAGVKGSQAAEVWTVTCVSQGTPILKGDSGSMVIDARSGELYGMVMAANPLGDIHIIPFAAIVAQITEFFETQKVSVHILPNGLSVSTTRPPSDIDSTEKERRPSERYSAFKTRFGNFLDDSNRIPELQYQGHSTDGDQRVQEMVARMNQILKKFEKKFNGEV